MASNSIAAAKCAAQPHIVRLSEMSPRPVSNLRMGLLQKEINEELEASGLPYTSLRTNFFMENTMMAAQTVASEGAVSMPLKDRKVGIVDISRQASELRRRPLGGREGIDDRYGHVSVVVRGLL